LSEPGTVPIAASRGARVLLFDFGGTLDADGVPWKERFWRIAREEGLDVSAAEFDQAFYGATDSLERCRQHSSGNDADGSVSRIPRRRS